MTFDTSFVEDDNRRPPPPPPKDLGFADEETETPLATRPEIKTSHTVPNITLSDPWADDDDEFGREKEISMTFA